MRDSTLFVSIEKVDESRRRVVGWATAEMMDRGGETMHYSRSKPHIKAWSDEIAKATGGKSLGNVRVMHPRTGNKDSVGRVVQILFDDANKRVGVEVEVDDEWVWQKVLKGDYAGFSFGGKGQYWTENNAPYYELHPHELSLVDMPMLQVGWFTVLKANGMEVKVAIHSKAEQLAEAALVLAERIEKMAKAKEGEVMDDNAKPVEIEALIEKFSDSVAERIEKAFGERLGKLEEAVETTIESLGRSLEPSKGSVRAVSKSADNAETEPDPKDKDEKNEDEPIEKMFQDVLNRPSVPWFMKNHS